MKKKILLTLLTVATTVSMLAGCGNSSSPAPAGTEAAKTTDASKTAETEGKKDYRIAVVVKGNTNGWFIRMEKGIKKWADEKGIEAWMTGPTDTDSSQQIQIIQDVINQDIDALCVVPVDPVACEPVLQEARDKGIVVICHEGSTVENCDYDIEAFNNAGYGAFIMDNLAKLMNEKGTYTTMVGFLSTASHNEWADGAVARQKEAYPGLTLLADLPRVESENNTETAYEKAKEVLKKYPDITGFTGSSSDDTPGIARAINELGLADSVHVVGTGMPNECRELLKNGSLTCITLWDPADAGYAMCELARMCLDGEEIGNGTNLGLSAYDNLVVDENNKKLLMGNGFISITADNVDDFDF
ncbi:MAG: autoinducer 2 ABC transporter substrate-binding protein [Lacrimispora sp.]|uniref:autoinducer 2 ABC transporter substrate-binding protein n=1 Tax=Lacrimispora sp. TaxID=2719234 RepID=UPI0039E62A38